MHRIDTPNKATDLFGAGKHGWRDGNKVAGINPTEFNAAMMNSIQEELAAIAEAAGLTLNPANNAQVLEAVQRLIDAQSGNYALDTGVANAYVVALNPAIAAYSDGMTVRVKIVNANTGASTLDAGGGAVPLVNDVGGALVAGDAPAGGIMTATFIASANKFYITSLVPSQAMSQTAADARYIALTAGGATVGQFRNLALSATGLNANVSCSADEVVVENAANAYQTLRAVNLTIAGTSSGVANGLDTGALAINTWYSVWVIYNAMTLTTAGLLSLSDTAPTLPNGYAYKARIGWVRIDNTANKFPLAFVQSGRRVQYKVVAGSNLTALPKIIAGVQGSTSVPTWVAASTVNFIPPTAGIIVVSLFIGTSANQDAMAAPNNSYGIRTSATNPPPICSYEQFPGNSRLGEFVLESSNIYYAASYASTFLACFGWEDNI